MFKILIWGEMKKRKQYAQYSAVDNEIQEYLVVTEAMTIKIKMPSNVI
jgi:hypothetical protein